MSNIVTQSEDDNGLPVVLLEGWYSLEDINRVAEYLRVCKAEGEALKRMMDKQMGEGI